MRNGLIPGAVFALTFFNWLPARQTASSPGVSSPGTRINFSALNKKERPILHLGEKDFELRVNGAPRTLNDFRAALPQTDRSIPLVAWILIDFNPNINAAILKNQAAAAADIFRLFHPDSLVGVKLVSDRSETLAPLAHDPGAIRRAFIEFGARRMQVTAGGRDDSISVGPGGMARAIELAVIEISESVKASARLAGLDTHRAVMILSDGNINPSYRTRPLYENAGRDEVFLYPVFIPRGIVGPWIEYYADLAKKSGGVAAALGAIAPGLDPSSFSGGNSGTNALTFNFLQMARDLNAKYSFTMNVPAGAEYKLSLKCGTSGVTIRMPRKTLP